MPTSSSPTQAGGSSPPTSSGPRTSSGSRREQRAPLVRAIHKSLAATTDGNLGEAFFLDLLRRGFSEDEARRQLDIAIDWGRYGELFDYDANTGQLSLEPSSRDAA